MQNKILLYKKLVENSKPSEIQNIWDSLDIFDWSIDSEKPNLTPQNIIDILNRYLNSTLSAEDVEKWAGFIEASDVAIGGITTGITADILNDLANPALEGELTKERALEFLEKLENRIQTTK